jgi:uncharacterized membrane protein
VDKINWVAVMILARSSVVLLVALFFAALTIVAVISLRTEPRSSGFGALAFIGAITGFCFKAVNWPNLSAAVKNVWIHEPPSDSE